MDLNGVLWFGTQSGVSRFDGFSWETYDVSDGLVNNVVTSITSDIDGALWFGTREGISKFKERTTSVSDLHGLNHTDFFGIQAVYPNPFNPATSISFSIIKKGYVSLSVYNLAGQKVATLVNRHINFGRNQIIWNAIGISSGVYLLVLESDNKRDFRKVLFVK